MIIQRRSQLTGVVRIVDLDITEAQLEDYYHKGMLLQDAFPHLDADDREFIKSGITPAEWQMMFMGAEEEEQGEE